MLLPLFYHLKKSKVREHIRKTLLNQKAQNAAYGRVTMLQGLHLSERLEDITQNLRIMFYFKSIVIERWWNTWVRVFGC